MKSQPRRTALALSLLVLAGCATSHVDLTEPRRVLGTQDDVRLDAEIRTDTLSSSQQLMFDYAITNNRATPIAVAELIPASAFDADSRVVTITIGTEVPGEELLPRLVVIAPGEKKEFTASARVFVPSVSRDNPFAVRPSGVQFELNFLGDPQPFHELIGIAERVVHDPKLAADLFSKWVEDNEKLVTNILPMRWKGEPQDEGLPETGGGRPRNPGNP